MNSNKKLSQYVATPDGILSAGKVTGYSTMIRQLDSGRFDSSLLDGLHVLEELQDAARNGWFKFTDEQMAITWRWLVACLFIHEQLDMNGIIEVENRHFGTDHAVIYQGDNGRLAIYPSTERLSLANHVEGISIKQHGTEIGLKMAVRFYECMAETDPVNGSIRLSTWGRDILTGIHDDFIQMLNAEGLPAQPVKH